MGELSCYFGFKYLVPLSDCQQIVQTFDRRKDYNGYNGLTGKYVLQKY